jgi:SAM-dependent methyltransferase
VLEYGCADGSLSLCELDLPQRCRSLTGIDISAVAIAKANAEIQYAGLTNARFMVMDAEATTFADQSFDLVFGRGILHHLDLTKCFSEIARVLRPGGLGIFSEPLGTNPVVNAIRNRTPDLRTADEHPFKMEDFEIARRSFAKVEIKFYGLFSAASALIDATAKGLPYRIGKAIDDVVLGIPVVRRYAWHCLLLCQKSPFIAKNVP